MSELEFDFVVIGAGIVGSWTAKTLTKYGKVLLLEQFREPHTRGSSHGQSRLIRSGYSEPYFAEMMPHAYRMWRQAENETNQKLIETTGALYVTTIPNNKNLMECINNMKKLCPENLVELNDSEMKLKYPDTLKFENSPTYFDKSGGVIFAHKAVTTVQKWFQSSGGIMWDSCKVTEILPLENKVLVKTCKNDVFAKSLIVTSGPWTKELLSNLVPSLPLEPKAIKVYYWKEKKQGAYSASSGFPAVLSFDEPPHIYSLPSLEYPGLMKVGIHDGVPCDPNERDKAPANEEHLNIATEYVKQHYPLLETKPAIIETCMYTCTPDEVFLIDRLPGYKHIVIGTGFSGTGFKTAPVVGRLLSELARGVEPFLDVTPYRLSRFANTKTTDKDVKKNTVNHEQL